MSNLISVIIPVYNTEQYLNDCVASVLAQTHAELEIILVDDGSTDGSAALCDEWAAKDPRIVAIHKPNSGVSDARNVGLEAAHGDYIGWVDSDDWIEPEMYQTLLDALLRENADIAACTHNVCYPDHVEEPPPVPYFVGGRTEFMERLWKREYRVELCYKLYRRKCWENVRFFSGKIHEDEYATPLVLHNAEKIVQLPQVFYHYRKRENSIMSKPFHIGRMDAIEVWDQHQALIKKYYPSAMKYFIPQFIIRINWYKRLILDGDRVLFAKHFRLINRVIGQNLIHVCFGPGFTVKRRLGIIRDYFKDAFRILLKKI